MTSHNSKYCKNPQTKRWIEIGGRTWRRLMKEGVVEQGGYKDPNVLYQISDADKYETVEDRRNHLVQEKERLVREKKVPKGYHPAISKNGKIIYQRAKMTNEESSRKTANAALDVVDAIQNNELEIPENMSRAQARDYLQGLIFNQMLSKGKKFKNTKLEALGRPKVVKKPVVRVPVCKPRSIQDYMPSRKMVMTKSRKPIQSNSRARQNNLTRGKLQKKVQFAKPKKEPVYYLPEEDIDTHEYADQQPIQEEEEYEEEDYEEEEEEEEEYYEEE